MHEHTDTHIRTHRYMHVHTERHSYTHTHTCACTHKLHRHTQYTQRDIHIHTHALIRVHYTNYTHTHTHPSLKQWLNFLLLSDIPLTFRGRLMLLSLTEFLKYSWHSSCVFSNASTKNGVIIYNLIIPFPVSLQIHVWILLERGRIGWVLFPFFISSIPPLEVNRHRKQ